MQSHKLFYLFLPLGLVCAQTPAPTTQKPKPPATGKAAGPAASTPKKAEATPAAKAATDDSKVVLTVGNEAITQKQFESYLQALPENMRAQATGAAKRDFAEQVVRLKILAQEAKKRGLDKDPAFQAKAAFQYENILAGQLYTQLQSSGTPDEAALRQQYEQRKTSADEVQARHILIRFKGSPVPLKKDQKELTEEEALAKAQDIRKQIAAGKDFAELAKAESDDTGSGANGGDLGKFRHGMMVPAFEQVAFSLPVGQVSEPVKTQFGYHLIKVESHSSKTFEEMKPELEAAAKPEAARKAVEDMRKNTPVKFDDAYFPAPAPPPAASNNLPTVQVK